MYLSTANYNFIGKNNIIKEKIEMNIQIMQIVVDTTVDGPGWRTSIYCAGCRHACPGCHNAETWPFDAGTTMSVDEIMEQLRATDGNITFSGGDPMFQPEGFAELARAIKAQSNKSIWCYTGFTFEQLIQQPAPKELLAYVDVLVDGPFIQTLRDESLLFRGSSNQRLIDVPASLQTGSAVLLKR